MKLIDNFLNRFTMYQVTLYSLIAYVLIAFVLSFFGFFQFKPQEILLSIAVTLVFCYTSNFVFSKIFKAVTNFESVFITALILTLIVPAKLPTDLGILIGASVLSMAVKYLPTIGKRHIFNPAAGGIAAYSLLFPSYIATWWIGTPMMFIPVLIGGFLVVRKAQRVRMVLIFLVSFAILTSLSILFRTPTIDALLNTLKLSFTQTALIFFATIMLTEPLTSPSAKNQRTIFAVLVSILYATPQMRFLSIVFTPEEALLLGNLYAYIVNPKYRLELKLKEKLKFSQSIFVFSFAKPAGFNYLPGQYMEWTLPHKNMDSRGNRRYLSFASSPTEDEVLMGVRFYEPPSSYKRKLINLKQTDKIIAADLAGDFTLPKDLSTPLAFISGGIGVTPFRSMIKYIADKKIKANIVFLYINKEKNDEIFDDVWKEAETFGVKTIKIISPKYTDSLTKLEEYIPDFKSRTFYISGPQLMVQGFKGMLKSRGVKKVITDYFPGYN